MINVAVTEDDREDAEKLRFMIDGFFAEHEASVCVTIFRTASELLKSGRIYDIVFMDIGLPDMSGMEAARLLRASDGRVIIIFCTTMARFAVEGYSVGAFDYLVKPVDKASFDMAFGGAIRRLNRDRPSDISVRTADGVVRLACDDITYIEIFDHKLVFHTGKRDICGWGSLGKLAERLKDRGFVQCNSCYVVNLRYVRSVREDNVVVGGTELHCSRSGMKNLMSSLAAYMD